MGLVQIGTDGRVRNWSPATSELRGEGEPNPMPANLSQYRNLILPGLYQWQSECPPHTELDMRQDVLNDVLIFQVNGEEADRVTAADLADDWGVRTTVAKHRMLAKAWEQEKTQKPAREAAGPRSEELLRKHLTEAQGKSLTEHGWIEVDGGKTGHVYRIHKDVHLHAGRNVELLINGEPIACYNAKPMKRGRELPWGDVVLTQKLALECDEKEFLAKACVAPLGDALTMMRERHHGVYLPDTVVDDPYGQYNEVNRPRDLYISQRNALTQRDMLQANLAQQNVFHSQLTMDQRARELAAFNRLHEGRLHDYVPAPTLVNSWLLDAIVIAACAGLALSVGLGIITLAKAIFP